MSGTLTGYGGFGAMSFGALPPNVETGLHNALEAVNDLHAQIYFDMRTLSDQGHDVSEYQATADAIATEINLAQTEIGQIDETQAAAMSARIADLDQRTRSVLAQTGAARQRAPEMQQWTGFGWGVGAVALAGALAWFIWDQSKTRRRRG